jgi:hypothetical protein
MRIPVPWSLQVLIGLIHSSHDSGVIEDVIHSRYLRLSGPQILR